MIRLLILLAVTSLGSLGCVKTVYQVDLVPDGEALRRTLTVYQHQSSGNSETISSIPDTDLESIGRLYQEGDITTDGDKHVFSGRFVGNMPADVGGFGNYTVFKSAFGSPSS